MEWINWMRREKEMLEQFEQLEQLRQKGLVDVDKWNWGEDLVPSSVDQQNQLLAVLHNDPQATVLDLGSCGIGDANAKVLAGHLKNNNTHLIWLALNNNELTDAGVQPLAQALANHPTLRELRLTDNLGITDASCPALADLLRTLPTLEELNLLDTRITAKGKAVLAAALGRTELNNLYIRTTAEERMLVARTYARWREDHHYRTAGDFRRNLAEALTCLEEDENAIIPWDDVQRVIQGWCIAKWRLR